MESLGEILKKKPILPSTSGADTGTWSGAEQQGEMSAANRCSLCKGVGLVYPVSPSGKTDFSRVVPCKCRRQDLKKEKLNQLQQHSNLGALSRLTFENLTLTGRQDDAASQELFNRAYDAAKTFAEAPSGWLVFVGPGGSGKTHLACAIANYCLSRGHPAFYIGAADLLDHLRSAFSPNSDVSHDELFEQVRNTPLLILDDLTMATTTAWAKGKMEQLLDHRFNACLATVITSDVPIVGFDEGIRGHLADTELCRVYMLGSLLSSLAYLGSLDLELLRKMTFKNFDYKRLNLMPEEQQNLEQAYRLALSFAQSSQGWLVLQGTNGCGKTHLAAAIANHIKQEGKHVLFIVVPDLLDHLRSTFGPDSKTSYDELFERIKQAQVLILDDFGEQSATPWAQEKLYQLINYRYNARLATVITTCLSLDEIEDRISSRMVDPSISLVFNIIAPDYRGDRGAARRAKLPQGPTRRRSSA
jgi:DNA replication protein DnaC